jgi:hypothetical protein
MVNANGGGTVDDLPMSSLQKLTEKLDDPTAIVNDEPEDLLTENIENEDDDLDVVAR